MNPDQFITLHAHSPRGRSRIGRAPVSATVEQKHELPNGNTRLFVVLNPSHCRWVLLNNDPDFTVS